MAEEYPFSTYQAGGFMGFSQIRTPRFRKHHTP